MRVYKVYGEFVLLPSSCRVSDYSFKYTDTNWLCDEYFYNTDDNVIEMIKEVGFGSLAYESEHFVYINIDHNFENSSKSSYEMISKIIKDVKNYIRDETLDKLLL